jgi:8-oxo-dGTP diphosphatase
MEANDAVAEPSALQFGKAQPGVKHRDRPAVFGVVERRGQIALIRVTREGMAPFHDLPGGAIEPGESEARALAREIGEETGLIVRCGELLSRADQLMVKSDGEPVNNRCLLVSAVAEGLDPTLKIEDCHKLVWVPPEEALRMVRLDSHAWAIACWIRRQARQAAGAAA